MSPKLRKLIAPRAFYAMVLAIVIPIIVQNAISNFVNLLDNLMVGRVGTEQMSGVAIANQLTFVFNLTIFGAVSGASIFSSQYHGAGNVEGVRAALRLKLYISVIVSAIAITLFALLGPRLVALYLNEGADPAREQRTLEYGMSYLRIMMVGLTPFALAQSYASTLRETGETAMPMYASILAVLVNLVFNYFLIFGKFGFPCLGVAGAAYATVLSRYVEFAFIAVYTHTHAKKHPFAHGLYRTLRIPLPIVRDITRKGTPLLVNELLWSGSIALLNQIYSLRGLDVVAATNISSVVYNLFSVAFLSMGSATAIIIGQRLGANDIETAKDYCWKLTAFSVVISLVFGLILFCCAGAIPHLYNTTAAVQSLATGLIRISAALMVLHSFSHCAYFILRSGGKTGITFLFDSGFSWVVCIPVAYVLAHFTDMPILPLYFCVQMVDMLKALTGMLLVRSGIWIQNIVENHI